MLQSLARVAPQMSGNRQREPVQPRAFAGSLRFRFGQDQFRLRQDQFQGTVCSLYLKLIGNHRY